jgi:hypothetical protein
MMWHKYQHEINYLTKLRGIIGTAVHALFESMSPKNERRIRLLNG